MTYLLDVNVLIALVDGAHLNHDAAHAWFSGIERWATCPLTENAFVRVLSHHKYVTVDTTPSEIVGTLRELRLHPGHRFVADDISLADAEHFDASLVGGSKAVTDVYLAGLAHRHGMTLATFDRRLRATAVVGASAETVELLG